MGLVPTESLPLGFRFRPTDQELMSHYLRLKINGHHSDVQVIPEVDVCKWEPWDLPRLSVIKTDDPEWFFFCPRDRKYPNGHRSNRATDAGYWKATGKDRTIKSHKSSPSGRSDTQLIGMKKTLVFYRGRAPKGERTNWIMHEYRATEPELDGTASGQAAYVLCRLFHKPDEKAENFRFDEVEASGSSPITVKSSPDDTSSDLFQEPSILDIQVGKQPEGIKRWLTDKSDDLTANSVLHVENCTSDVEDHLAEASPTEVYPSLGGDPMSHDSNDGLDCQVFSPILLHKDTDTGCAGSPFADDFGSNQNGIHFQDGTSEQDVSLTELFDVLQNNGDYLCEESTSQTFSDVGKEILLSGHIECLHQGPAENYNLRDWGSFCKTDDDMVQEQVQRSPRSFQSQAAAHHIESSMSNMGVLDDHSAVKDVSSANDIIDPLYNDEKTRTCAAPVSSGGNLQGRTGIKIQKRQPRRRSGLETLATQGTAARRIHLQMDSVPVSTCGGKSDNSSNFSYEEQEDQSVITQAAESAKTVLESDELAVGSIISDKRVTTQESNAGLGLRNKQGHEKDGPKRRSFVLWKPLPGFRGTSFLTGYAVSMYLVIVLLIVFVGMWKCPNFHALCI